MRRLLLFVVAFCLLVFVGIQVVRDKLVRDLAQPITESVLSPSPTTVLNNQNTKSVSTSVFIPYWALSPTETFSDAYDQYIYFGITPNTNGIAQEEGSAGIEQFRQAVPNGKESFLTLRMVDSQINAAILKNKAAQKKIITQTVSYAKANDFSGVILDFEMSAIPFDSLIQQISSFNQALSKEVKDASLTYGITIYGDTFYRIRPFDVKALSEKADMVLIMAYDLHKAHSNPGPNFPLKGRERYGYDMALMIDDTLRVVPAEKVTVIFGMFGYDWIVDNQGKATARAKALSIKQIQQQFLEGCEYSNCQIRQDQLSSEMTISYTDTDHKKHIVWFEDERSVSAKKSYLQKRNISSFSYWAYTYF